MPEWVLPKSSANTPGISGGREEKLMNVMAATEILARSTTLTSVGWLGYIIIGALAGWIAGMIMKTKEGLVLDIVIGVAGALIGGFLRRQHRQRRLVVHPLHRRAGSGHPALDAAAVPPRVAGARWRMSRTARPLRTATARAIAIWSANPTPMRKARSPKRSSSRTR